MNTALAQLRAKTDRDLLTLIRKEVERARADAARGYCIQALHSIEQAEAWLQVAGFSVAERTRLERSILAVRAAIQTPATACA